MRNLGDDAVADVDYEKHDRIVRNLEDFDVIHVDLQETFSGHEKPRERRSNTRGLRRTWSGPKKPRRRRSNTRGLRLTRSVRAKLRRRRSTTRGFSKKPGPVVNNFEDDEVIDEDYLKHGPVAKNVEDAEVIHVDY